MPYVNVKVTREGVTAAQKAEVIEQITGVLAEVLGKNPDTTVVVIEEVDLESWGMGGLPVQEFRRRATS